MMDNLMGLNDPGDELKREFRLSCQEYFSSEEFVHNLIVKRRKDTQTKTKVINVKYMNRLETMAISGSDRWKLANRK